jgi:hypothetical protein
LRAIARLRLAHAVFARGEDPLERAIARRSPKTRTWTAGLDAVESAAVDLLFENALFDDAGVFGQKWLRAATIQWWQPMQSASLMDTMPSSRWNEAPVGRRGRRTVIAVVALLRLEDGEQIGPRAVMFSSIHRKCPRGT